MNFISLFSGIDAASVAWNPLGWRCMAFSEIDRFPCKILAHHYVGVPNLGDVARITKVQLNALGEVGLVVFGFPCQDLSIAGKRAGLRGLDGEATRSGLFFEAIRVVRECGARWAVAENVPGLFSSNGGLDFAAVVGEMAGVCVDVPDGGWPNSGLLAGPDALVEWTVLDAQYFGVPQRRRRVFIVRDTGDWRGRPPIFLEQESMCGHPPPSREARQIAPTIPSRRLGGGGLGTDFDCDGGLVESAQWPTDVAPTLNAHYGDKQGLEDQHIGGGQVSSSTGDTAHCLNAGGMGRQDFETETLLAVGGFFDHTIVAPITSKPYGDNESQETKLVVTHSLRGDGFDASEDGTGRGTPLVPVAIQNATRGKDQNGLGISDDGTMYTLDQASQHAVCFMPARTLALGGGVDSRFAEREICDAIHTGTGHGNKASLIAIPHIDIMPTMQNGADSARSHSARSGDTKDAYIVPVALAYAPETGCTMTSGGKGERGRLDPLNTDMVAFNLLRGRKGGAMAEMAEMASIRAASGGSSRTYVGSSMAVRRLTPRECERLQGFRDDYTKIGDNTADNPRYKALGNSMAVPVMAWIGHRIQMIEDMPKHILETE